MRVRNLVWGVLLVAACGGPEEVFRPGQAIGQPAGTGGIGNLPVTTGGAGTGGALPPDVTGGAGTSALPGLAGTGGGAAGTTGAAGTGAAGTGVAGTGAAGTGSAVAGTGGLSAGGAGGSSNRDGGAPGTAGTSAPIDAAPEVAPTTPYSATGWKPTASVTAAGNADVAANAFDGNIKTRWATGRSQAGNESFLLDLGASKSVSRVVLDNTTHPNDFPVAYTLEVSTNATAFTNPTTGKGAVVTDIAFTRVMARYIRIRQTGMTPAPNGAWWSIDEIKVYP